MMTMGRWTSAGKAELDARQCRGEACECVWGGSGQGGGEAVIGVEEVQAAIQAQGCAWWQKIGGR